MVTAIFPARINKNSFWSSDTGLACLDSFLTLFSGMADIDRFFVITQDTQVCHLAEKYGMSVLKLGIPGTIDRPYTFEQTMALAQDFQNSFSNQEDDLIIIDHRNILISPDDVTRAMLIYRQNPNSGVISLTSCRDHPCQYRAYFTFMGCVIFNCKDVSLKNTSSNGHKPCISKIVKSPQGNFGDITVTVILQNETCGITFNCQTQIPDGLMAQILPFTTTGPLYENFVELYIPTADYQALQGVVADQLEGVIVTVVMADSSGSYDTLECFTPKSADWELGGAGNRVVDKENRAPIQGRQQFTPVYTYDGSLCVINTRNLSQLEKIKLLPFLLNDSRIISDWVDYCSTI